MAILKDIHDTLDEIPENYRELYTERNKKWELTGITGIKTTADVTRIQESLNKERTDHKTTKEGLGTWGDWNKEEIQAKLDKIPELEALAGGNKIDDEKMEELVNARIASKIAPYDRKVADLEKANGELTVSNEVYVVKETRRSIKDAIDAADLESKIGNLVPSAREDVYMLGNSMLKIDEQGKIVTKEDMGVTPAMDVAGWLAEMQPKRGHWYPASGGGGADGDGNKGGGISENPYSDEHWNKTNQAAYYREHGPEKAARAAKLAGTRINGPRPKKK